MQNQGKYPKVLDALLLAFSCRVKNPELAIKSKLCGENIIDVKEEDLELFPNLTMLDVSENHLLMS